MMKVELLEHTPNPERVIASAAKLCYSAADVDDLLEAMTPEKTESFINMLMGLGHESPFEHASFTFAVEGVSRSLLAQVTRHRIASFSVQSQRYVGKENFEYIMPPAVAANGEAKKLFLEAMEQDRETYKKLHDLLEKDAFDAMVASGADEKTAARDADKKANEDARYVLSNACDTKIIMTMNVRELYHFFALRTCERAQWEIRNMATEMLRICKQVSPVLFAKAGPACVRGNCAEGAKSCGKATEKRVLFASLA